MSFKHDTPDADATDETSNKDETEIPIGEAQAPESKDPTMWRCGDCGEMKQFEDTLPMECPNCNAPKEALYYLEED